MSSCSPPSSSAFQDESASSSRETTRKILGIRLVMKRPEVDPETEELVHTGAKESASECSGSSARECNSKWFTGRRGRKRKQSTPDGADTSNADVEASTTTTAKEKIVMSPISGETRSASFMASARSAAEQEATRSHMTCNNKKVKSVATNEEPRTHKCKLCPAAFATGQKLGGHMRAHYKGTISISASSSSKRAEGKGKGKGIVQAGLSSGTARNKAPVGSSSESVKDKDSNASSSTEAPTKNTAAAAASSRSVTREMVVPLALDLNELPADREGEEQLIIDEEDQIASPLDLTLSLWISSN